MDVYNCWKNLVGETFDENFEEKILVNTYIDPPSNLQLGESCITRPLYYVHVYSYNTYVNEF